MDLRARLRSLTQDTKKLITLALGPAFILLAIDAGISHFAGKPYEDPYQLIPIVFGIVAAGLLVAAPLVPQGPFLWTLRGVGVCGAAVGGLGTLFHLVPLFKDLGDEKLTFGAVEGALSLAPPVFAPGAFLGLGVALIVLASPRVSLSVDLSSPVPVPSPRKEHTLKPSLLALALLALSTPAFADEAVENWKAKCKSCHGETGKGDTKVGQKEKVDDLSTAAWQSKATDANIKAVIQNGSKDNSKMKPFKDKLSDAEIDALVKLVRSFKS